MLRLLKLGVFAALPILAACNQNPSPGNDSVDAGRPKLKPADAGPCPQPYCPETVYDRIGEPAGHVVWRYTIYAMGEVYVHADWIRGAAASAPATSLSRR